MTITTASGSRYTLDFKTQTWRRDPGPYAVPFSRPNEGEFEGLGFVIDDSGTVLLRISCYGTREITTTAIVAIDE